MTFKTPEPKTVWCPFARAREWAGEDGNGPIVNRDPSGTPDSGCMCLGAGCAAWRWDEPPTDQPEQHRNGYCGLAGNLRYL